MSYVWFHSDYYLLPPNEYCDDMNGSYQAGTKLLICAWNELYLIDHFSQHWLPQPFAAFAFDALQK